MTILLYPWSLPDYSPFSHSVLPVLSLPYLVLSTIYLFMKVSFSPDISPRGWLGSKHQLTNVSCQYCPGLLFLIVQTVKKTKLYRRYSVWYGICGYVFFFCLFVFSWGFFFFFFIDSFLKTSSTKSSEIKWTHYACHSPIQAMQDCKGHFYCSVLKDKTQCLKLHRLNDTHVPLSPTPPVLHPLSPCINPCFFDLYPYKCRLRRSSLFFLFFFFTGLRTECLPAQVIIWTAG